MGQRVARYAPALLLTFLLAFVLGFAVQQSESAYADEQGNATETEQNTDAEADANKAKQDEGTDKQADADKKADADKQADGDKGTEADQQSDEKKSDDKQSAKEESKDDSKADAKSDAKNESKDDAKDESTSTIKAQAEEYTLKVSPETLAIPWKDAEENKSQVTVTYSAATKADDITITSGDETVAAVKSKKFNEDKTITVTIESKLTAEPTAAKTVTFTIKANKSSEDTAQSLTKDFKVVVAKGVISKNDIWVAPNVVYNGKPQTGVSVSESNKDKCDITDGSMTNATDSTPYTAKVKPKAGYVWDDGTNGDVQKQWTIEKADLSNVTLAIADQKYTGSPLTPAVSGTLNGTDYSIGAADYDASYANNTDAGTATVTLTGKGNFTGTATATFKVLRDIEVTKDSVADIKKAYDGEDVAISPKSNIAELKSSRLVVKYSKDKGKTYTQSASDICNVGEHTVYYQISDKDGVYQAIKGTLKATVTDPSSTQTDDDTGIIATGDVFKSSDYNKDHKVVKLVAEEASDSRVKELRSDYYESNNTQLFKVYDVSIVVENTKSGKVEETLSTLSSGSVELKFPVDTKYNNYLAEVFDLHKNGSKTEVITYSGTNMKVSSGTITLGKVTKFSEFVVTVVKKTSAKAKAASSTTKKGSAVSKTSDDNAPWIPAGIAVVALAVAGFAGHRFVRYRK